MQESEILVKMRAMSSKVRLDIVRALWTRGDLTIEMQELKDMLGISSPLLSQNIKTLKDAGMVYVTPHGRASSVSLISCDFVVSIMDALDGGC